MNSIYSLFFRENYQKLFDNEYLHIENQIDILNGLQTNISATFRKILMVGNYSDYSFFHTLDKTYLLNIPENSNLSDATGDTWNSLNFKLELRYTPEQYYRISNGKKYIVKSRFPTFKLTYQKGIKNILNSNTDFDLLQVGINYKYEWTGFKFVSIALSGGKFLNRNQIHFTDFKHFNTQNLPVYIGDMNTAFSLLNDYKSSSSDFYTEAHLQFSTLHLILKYIPWISNRLWTENIFVHYLNNEQMKHYSEIGYSLNNISFFANLGVYAGFQNGNYNNWGFRVILNFN